MKEGGVRRSMRGGRRVAASVIALLVVVAGVKSVVPYLLVANSVPGELALSDEDRGLLLNATAHRSEAVDEMARLKVLQGFADRDVASLKRDTRSGGTRLSQIILANLMLKQNIEQSNRLLRELTVWGNAGSSWTLNKSGDYDFSLIWLTSILYEFGEDEELLSPSTRDYLLEVLLTEEGPLKRMVPHSAGLVFDTENHLLMREGSRYLKNQWLKGQGDVARHLDNERNGLEGWLVGYLNHMRVNGVYEYNSTPYVVYTLLPLMNLADYAESEVVRRLALSVTDQMASRYAFGSLGLRQCAPFRRQNKYAESQSLRLNRMGILVRFLMDGTVRKDDLLVFASVIHDYRLPQQTLDRFAGRINDDYFALYVHEAKGGREIYSGGSGYLLSAGGACQGRQSKVIARPISLLLDDGAESLDECIHIRGIGDWKQWNMSGVHRRFAAARGAVVIPERFHHDRRSGWQAIQVTERVGVAVYQQDTFSILLVLPDLDLPLDEALRLIKEANAQPEQAHRFVWPEKLAPVGIHSLSFDVDAEPASWVIASVNEQHPE